MLLPTGSYPSLVCGESIPFEVLEKLLQGFQEDVHGPYEEALIQTLRVVLYKAWRDAECIPAALPDGDFLEASLSSEFKFVLGKTYRLTLEPYRWLFDKEALAFPTHKAWHQAIQQLAGYRISGLPQDYLGSFYEAMLSTQHRKTKGTYYTDPRLMAFILDRVGLVEEAYRKTPTVYDPALGTGGFLLASAQRMLNAGMDASTLLSTHYGSERDLLSCYITQVNFLLLLLPVVQQRPEPAEALALGILQADSLALFHVPPAAGEMPESPLFQDGAFDFCIGNPPYIGEKGHKEIFQEILEKYPAWKPYYQGRMDYLYFFIHLGISKLKEGGRLGYITTRYWLTADGAETLRRDILTSCRILEIIDFGDNRVFEQATGQHNVILILEKCGDVAKRNQHYPRWIRIQTQQGTENGDFLNYFEHHAQEVHGWLNEGPLENAWVEVNTSTMPQGEWLSFEAPAQPSTASPKAASWHWQKSHQIEELLEKIKAQGEPLATVFYDQQGVISGADKVTRENIKWLSSALIEEQGIQVGDGIFCLTTETLAGLNLTSDEQALVKPFFKNSHISPYGVHLPPPAEQAYLLYLTPDIALDPYPQLHQHLLKFKPILERKRECRIGKLPWYSLHWPRQQWLLEAPALVTPRRAPHNCFALAPAGYYKNSDLTILALRPQVAEDLLYFLALLNSPVLEFWMAHRGKPKGKMREYFSTPLQVLPLKRLEVTQPGTQQLHQEIVERVQALMREAYPLSASIQEELHERVAALYNLSPQEQALLRSRV